MSQQSFVTQWMIDTRDLWHVSSTGRPSDQMAEFSSRVCGFPLLLLLFVIQLLTTSQAAPQLLVLPDSTREKCLRYVFPKDARMSLASALLKHLIVTTLTVPPVSWSSVVISADTYGKPCFLPSSSKQFDFNVSHQAGLVSMIASKDASSEVGTDIVCVNERIDQIYTTIDSEGFDGWVDLHADVFHEEELKQIKYGARGLDLDCSGWTNEAVALSSISRCVRRSGPDIIREGSGAALRFTARQVIDAKLRKFYAYWALREAYVKMTGEALLAPWLRQLSFVEEGVRAPRLSCCATEQGLEAGEVIENMNVWRAGVKVTDVALELRAYGKYYMIASAVRQRFPAEIVFPGYETLDLERDVMSNTGVASIE